VNRLRHIATCATAISLAAVVLLPASGAVASSGGVSANPNAPFLRVTGGVLINSEVKVTGRVSDVSDGSLVDVQARLPGKAWTRVASGRSHDHGTFAATWTTTHIGKYTLRAVPRNAASASATDGSTPPVASSIVHFKNRATWFGPEDNGTQTACGVKLTDTVLGVAHKSLPCGTQVSILFRGKRITVPVIDRGPYRDGVTWDLTIATSEALGFTDVGLGTVGAVALRDEPLAAFARKQKN
jgi:rare lipoprotein A (peptidoglycan hydrolase)